MYNVKLNNLYFSRALTPINFNNKNSKEILL